MSLLNVATVDQASVALTDARLAFCSILLVYTREILDEGKTRG
jgi:hypothetical protein